MNNGLPELLGDRAPAFQSEVAQYGGCSSDINLAYYYPVSKEVVYLGHMHEMSITQSLDNHAVHYGGREVAFRGRRFPTEIGIGLYVDPSMAHNISHVVTRYTDELHSFSYDDIVGTLIGYFDLKNGDQIRFMFPKFLLTSYEMVSERFNNNDIHVSINGQFQQGSIQNIHYARIEETKKIDYSQIKTLEQL